MPKDQNFVKEEYAPVVQRSGQKISNDIHNETLPADELKSRQRIIFRLELFIGFMFFVIGAAHRAAGPMAFLATPIIFVAGILRSILQQVLPLWREIERSVRSLWLWNLFIGVGFVALGFLTAGVVLMSVFHTPLFHN